MNTPYGEVAPVLLEKGIIVMPLKPKSKMPSVKDWSNLTLERAKEISEKACQHPFNIGCLLGSKSDIIALDFDYDVDGLHDKLKALCPPTPVSKTGAKGVTMFYRFNGEPAKKWSKGGEMVLELLSDGNQTAPNLSLIHI